MGDQVLTLDALFNLGLEITHDFMADGIFEVDRWVRYSTRWVLGKPNQ
jgi:hypothetical protein